MKKTENTEIKAEQKSVAQIYIDKKTGKAIEPIVLRKEHRHMKLFWKAFYGAIGFLERHVPHNVLQFIKYSMLSACAGAVEVVVNTTLNFSLEGVREKLGMVFWIIDEIYVTNLIATLVGLVLGVLCNFLINRKFTFRAANNAPKALTFVLLFYIVITPLKTMWNGLMPQYLYAFMGVAGASTFINLCGMFIIGFLEFCYQKFFVYKNAENSALKKKK